MTVMADPVAAHVAELDRMLRGPGAVKRSMIAEVHDGLHDAAEAYRESGLDPQQAAATAVQDFGTVREIAPLLQEELIARQGRSTAVLLAVAFPTLLVGWDLLWSHGVGWSGRPPEAVAVMARVQDVTTAAIGAIALTLLLVTFRRGVSPRLCTALAGATAAAGSLVCGGTAVAMNLANAEQTASMIATNPPGGVALAVSAVALVLVVRSAVRSLRIVHASEPDALRQ